MGSRCKNDRACNHPTVGAIFYVLFLMFFSVVMSFCGKDERPEYKVEIVEGGGEKAIITGTNFTLLGGDNSICSCDCINEDCYCKPNEDGSCSCWKKESGEECECKCSENVKSEKRGDAKVSYGPFLMKQVD